MTGAASEGDKADYAACVLGLRDYVNKNGFKGVVLGMSGGIDSALCAAMAVDALGRERVRLILFGHVHRPVSGVAQGIAFAGCPSTAHQVALELGPHGHRQTLQPHGRGQQHRQVVQQQVQVHEPAAAFVLPGAHPLDHMRRCL